MDVRNEIAARTIVTGTEAGNAAPNAAASVTSIGLRAPDQVKPV